MPRYRGREVVENCVYSYGRFRNKRICGSPEQRHISRHILRNRRGSLPVLHQVCETLEDADGLKPLHRMGSGRLKMHGYSESPRLQRQAHQTPRLHLRDQHAWQIQQNHLNKKSFSSTSFFSVSLLSASQPLSFSAFQPFNLHPPSRHAYLRSCQRICL